MGPPRRGAGTRSCSFTWGPRESSSSSSCPPHGSSHGTHARNSCPPVTRTPLASSSGPGGPPPPPLTPARPGRWMGRFPTQPRSRGSCGQTAPPHRRQREGGSREPSRPEPTPGEARMREGAEEEDRGGGGGNPCRSSRKLWLNTHKIHHLSHFRAQFNSIKCSRFGRPHRPPPQLKLPHQMRPPLACPHPGTPVTARMCLL